MKGWIPVASIIIKLALALYTHTINRVIQSAMLRTMFKDNVSDAILTAMTLISLLLAPLTTLPLDGVAGLLIAAAIMWSGITSFQEHLSLLLGKGTDKELIEQIVELVLKQDNVFSGVESIATYDFGPEKRLAFIQVCLKASPHLENVQIAIQKLTEDLKQTLNLKQLFIGTPATTKNRKEVTLMPVKKLSISKENYLKTILSIEQEQGYVRAMDIAKNACLCYCGALCPVLQFAVIAGCTSSNSIL